MKKLLFLVAALIFMISPTETKAAFSDLPESHHHYFPLSYLEFEGIIQGYADGTVRPGQLINRAELIKILVEGLGFTPTAAHKNCFPDVKEEWFSGPVCFAKEKDWIGGYPDGTFRPGEYVIKAEALKIILNAFGVASVSPRASLLFSDTPNDAWYAPYLAAGVQKNLLEEIGGATFHPSNPRNRGEIAEMVARIKMIQHMNDPKYTDWIRAEFENYLLLHELRRENGVTEKLKLNPILTKTAREHSRDMAENIGNLNHYGSDGRASFDRMEDAGIPVEVRTGENIGRNYVGGGKALIGGIEQVHRNIFMPEDPNVCNHRTTILSICLPYKEVGIGVYVKDGYLYFTNDFVTTEYADNIQDLSVLQYPSEYDNNPIYQVNKSADMVTVIASACNSTKVRSAYYINVGVFYKDGNCGIYEQAWAKNPDWDVIREYVNNQVFQVWYTSTYYTSTRPSENPAFFEIRPQLVNGWSIVGHENPNLPAYADIGETKTFQFQNSNTNTTLRFRLKFEEGFVTVTQF